MEEKFFLQKRTFLLLRQFEPECGDSKGLTIKSGQTHVHRYLPLLMGKIEKDEIDPPFVISHCLELDDAPEAYKTFRDKEDGCIKVVMNP